MLPPYVGIFSYVKEMIRLKPEFAGELNQNGFGPVHLASANGHVEIVKELLMVNRHHCRLKGRDRSTPLHYATVEGRIGVINELISCCEESFEDVTIRDETALHLAVKNNQFEALKIMVDMLRQLNKGEILNKKDQEGNTVLHLATSSKQREAVELLLMKAPSSTPLEVNLMNKSNLTALDYLLILPMEPNDRDIEAMLRQAGAKRAQEIGQVLDLQILENYTNNQAEITVAESPVDRLVGFFKFRRGRDSPSDARNALLVIVVLIATATYQAGLSPPGGVWQDSGNASTNQTAIGSSNYVSTNTSGYAPGVSILSDMHLGNGFYLQYYDVYNYTKW
ncbi:ankyrin repeat-containing protein BDA1-like isoform X2 [Papaver somniferum]|uniref:ankyrin repeat-containing protein BDA1-like isoform X2 n=1 Tax=Papaver somniferum TaxID=3469 RepID=UPI000E6FC5EE|nr:ankyrin repeat-containing protein BDA1-like isoform X2 [Papaver somniferum]